MELDEYFIKYLRTNALANIHLFNLFMPQILKGQVKKVVTISSGMGDMDFTKDYDVLEAPLYSTSKAAMNMISAKFSAQYKEQGVLFLAICPGMVEVGHFDNSKSYSFVCLSARTHLADLAFFTVTPDKQEGLQKFVEKFKRYSPTFKGADSPPESIKAVMSVVNNSSIENGAAGAYLSHFGNKRWV